MKLLILYRPNSEHATLTESFVRDFGRQHTLAPEQLALLSIDTREGAEMAKMYDIVSYPALLVTTEDGAVVANWSGEPLPLMNEVAGFMQNNR